MLLDEGVLKRLAQALEDWQDHGFIYTPLPWMVPPAYLELTRPSSRLPLHDFMVGDEGLLASGEQAFLLLDHQRRLPPGSRYIGWTPCFREEPVFDDLHQRSFIKAEVFGLPEDGVSAVELLNTVRHQAMACFATLAGDKAVHLAHCDMGDGSWDIVLDGVEVGSYGVRQRAGGGAYVYGTALAEPRWSVAIRRC